MNYFVSLILNGALIAEKILVLAEEKGISKSKLGEVAGARKDQTAQWKYNRFHIFIKNLKKGIIDEMRVREFANFFNLSPEYFLGTMPQVLHSPEKHVSQPPASLKKVANGLREMGYSEDFIEGHILALRTNFEE